MTLFQLFKFEKTDISTKEEKKTSTKVIHTNFTNF